MTTHYLHASKLLVKAGDKVKQGQVIMKCGSTG
ncbi:MAG: peptidoglycan DD-metalloendopeptidase family protein, partial [Lachnospiraceae bacterium]|nr:peptidoglycan DD-metalloendopeptidase family protein [Lachnospiraceae bacterium]